MAINKIDIELRLIKTEKALKELEKFKKQAEKAIKKLKKFKKQSKTTTDSVSKGFKAAAKSVLGFVTAAYALKKIKDVFVDVIKESMKFKRAFLGLESLAKSFGQNMVKAKMAARDLSRDGLMTVTDAAESLKNLLATGFGLDEAIKLLWRMKDITSFNRQGTLEFGQAIISATTGIKNQNSILVDNIGLTKNLSKIMRERGFRIRDLSDEVKGLAAREALYLGLMKEMNPYIGDAAKLSKEFEGATAKLAATMRELKAEIGDIITKNKRFKKSFETISNVIIKTVKAIRDLTKYLDTLANKFDKYIRIKKDFIKTAIYGRGDSMVFRMPATAEETAEMIKESKAIAAEKLMHPRPAPPGWKPEPEWVEPYSKYPSAKEKELEKQIIKLQKKKEFKWPELGGGQFGLPYGMEMFMGEQIRAGREMGLAGSGKERQRFSWDDGGGQFGLPAITESFFAQQKEIFDNMNENFKIESAQRIQGIKLVSNAFTDMITKSILGISSLKDNFKQMFKELIAQALAKKTFSMLTKGSGGFLGTIGKFLGFQHGGLVPGHGAQLAVVHGGEYVVPKKDVDKGISQTINIHVTGVSNGYQLANELMQQLDNNHPLRMKLRTI